jgi:hypothetical protein
MWVRAPENSSGDRTSTSWPWALTWVRTSSRKARSVESLRFWAVYFEVGLLGSSMTRGRCSFIHLSRPPSMMLQLV